MKWFDDRPRLKERLKPFVRAFRAAYGAVAVWLGRPLPRRLGPVVLGIAAAFAWRAGRPAPSPAAVAGVALASIALFRALWENYLKVRPLNNLVRYFAVLDILASLAPHLPRRPRILEAGSGAEGLGHLLPYPFWGCDIHFAGPINPNMTAVRASSTALPFDGESFDVVLSLDCLEHIPGDADRRKALEEMWRVAKDVLIVAFPAGRPAAASDRALLAHYRRQGLQVPDWLKEHIANDLPDEGFVESFLGERRPLRIVAHESPRFHLWMMRREASLPWRYGFMAVIFWTRVLLRPFLRRLTGLSPAYRRIYVIAKKPGFAATAFARGAA